MTFLVNLKVTVTLREVFCFSPNRVNHLCPSELILSVTPGMGGVFWPRKGLKWEDLK